MLFEGDVPGEQFPDVNFGIGSVFALLGRLCGELKLVTKSLIERCNNEGVLGQHEDLRSVEVLDAFALLL